MPKFLTVHEFAELIGQCLESIRRKVKLGQIPQSTGRPPTPGASIALMS